MDQETRISRHQFLRKLGFNGAALMAVYCAGLTGCGTDVSASPQSVDFTLDLTQSANSALNTTGGYIVVNSVVIARITSSTFAAVTQICSHEGSRNVVYVKSTNQFYCSRHGATYNTSGQGTNSLGSNGLRTYTCELTGTNLHVAG